MIERNRKLQALGLLAALTPAFGLSVYALAPSTTSTNAPTRAQASKPEADVELEEIVITGTLIRGKEPVGSNVITVGADKLEETGAISSNELLASIPQVTNYFNRVPVADLAIAVNQIQISRPNLRNISPNNASSSATLILVDGHRIATAGVNQASIDPDLIPTGAIERVEVVTEGGSAIYGADAVAGVINFITRKRFDGVTVGGSYGFADEYSQRDANFTAGKDWGSGSALVSYSYVKSDALYGRDRDFIRNVNYTSQPYLGRDRNCVSPNLAVNTVFVPANVTLSSTNYALPGLVANTFNPCDNSQDSTAVPEAIRHGVMAGVTQDLNDTTSIDLRAYYGKRETKSSSVLNGTVNVGGGNPYTAGNLPAGVVLGGGVVATRAAVSFSMQPLLGLDSQHSDTSIEEWGATAEIKQDLGDNWQLRGLLNWSESDSGYNLTGISNARLAAAGTATTTATAFNPFDVTNNNPALIADLINSEIAGQAKDTLLNARVIAEGKLFELAGGDARLAAGYEFTDDSLKQRFRSDIGIGTLGSFPFAKYSRHVHSVFGELVLPLISDGKGGSMLTVSASGRYDDYSDFGNTTNPKLGVTFKPISWLTFRGNVGTSFTAPTPLDQLGSSRNTISAFPFVAFTRPGDTTLPGSYTVALQGSKPDLQPQKADTWSVGFDIDAPFVEGLRINASYYDVKFKDILSTPTPNAGIFTNFPANITTNVTGVTPAELQAFGALAPGGDAVVNPLIASGTRVYELVDFRTGNFGILQVTGVDFGVNYRHDTGFGGVDFGVNGNLQLSRDQQASPTAAKVDVLATETPDLTLQTSVGANIGAFRAQATWNHSAAYDIVATTSVPVQTKVKAFDTINLFFKYDIPADAGILKDLYVTLNVSNVFDKDPPELRRNNPNEFGYANGFTLGRMFSLGVSKKF